MACPRKCSAGRGSHFSPPSNPARAWAWACSSSAWWPSNSTLDFPSNRFWAKERAAFLKYPTGSPKTLDETNPPTPSRTKPRDPPSIPESRAPSACGREDPANPDCSPQRRRERGEDLTRKNRSFKFDLPVKAQSRLVYPTIQLIRSNMIRGMTEPSPIVRLAAPAGPARHSCCR